MQVGVCVEVDGIQAVFHSAASALFPSSDNVSGERGSLVPLLFMSLRS